jgi:glutathione S-transferase
MKLFMTPGSCTTGIHILMEEIGLFFEAHILNLPAGDNAKPAYLALNPKGTIPTLVRDDGAPLTEFQAIAFWLARKFPAKGLLPEDADAAAKAMEVMDYVVGTLHMQAFARIFTPEKFALSPEDVEAVKARGRHMVDEGFAIVDGALTAGGYVAGAFSIADAALFYVEFWADKTGIALPPNCLSHYRLMLSRPVVRRVLAEEGYRVQP